MQKVCCSVERCINYKNRGCLLEETRIDGPFAEDTHTTYCASFQLRSSVLSSRVKSTSRENSEIRCEAQYCKYNSDHKCHARRVYVEGCGADTVKTTECSSFLVE